MAVIPSEWLLVNTALFILRTLPGRHQRLEKNAPGISSHWKFRARMELLVSRTSVKDFDFVGALAVVADAEAVDVLLLVALAVHYIDDELLALRDA